MGMPMDPVSTTIDAAAWKYLLPGFFLRLGCAAYEPIVQRTNGAFHFADRLCNVRTERSILRIGCAAYGRGIPFCRSAVQRTDGAFHFYGWVVQCTNGAFPFTD